MRRLFWNQWSILGSTMGNDAEFDAIVEELQRGPARAARRLACSRWRRGARRSSGSRAGEQFGKVVVRSRRERRRARAVRAGGGAARSARRSHAAKRPSLPARRHDDDDAQHRRRIVRAWLRAKARMADLSDVQAKRDLRCEARHAKLNLSNRERIVRHATTRHHELRRPALRRASRRSSDRRCPLSSARWSFCSRAICSRRCSRSSPSADCGASA